MSEKNIRIVAHQMRLLHDSFSYGDDPEEVARMEREHEMFANYIRYCHEHNLPVQEFIPDRLRHLF